MSVVRRWEAFFEPYCTGNISAWIASCSNVVSVHKPRSFWWPGLHGRFSWPVRAWYWGRAERVCEREGW